MPKALIAANKGNDYTEEDVSRALYALIAFGGNPAPAARALESAFDLKIPTSTLRSWREGKHANRYAQLQAEHANDIEEALVRDTRDIARAASAMTREAIERTAELMADPRLRATEAAQIAASMAKVQQSNIDKLLALTGRPQAITEHRSAQDIIRALQAKGVIEIESAE
jgi:hypothetical protein